MAETFSASDTGFSVTDVNGVCRVKVGSFSSEPMLVVNGNTELKPKPQQPVNTSNWIAPDDWREPLWTERWSAYFSAELRSIWGGLSDVQKLAFSIAFHEMSDDMHSLAIESAGY